MTKCFRTRRRLFVLLTVTFIITALGLTTLDNSVFANIRPEPFFSVVQPFGVKGTPIQALATGDLNNDGNIDIVAGNRRKQSMVFLNDGRASFSSVPDYSFGLADGNTTALALGDLDADGDLDVVVANLGQPNTVHFNNGLGVYTEQFYLTSSGISINFPFNDFVAHDNSTDIALGDLDGDGDLDIAVANGGINNYNKLYFNEGDGQFTSPVPYGLLSSQGSVSNAVALGDMDNDGDLDIVSGNGGVLPSTVLLNQGGKFYFGLQTSYDSCPQATDLVCFGRRNADYIYSTSIRIGDLNNDGKMDIVSSNLGVSFVYLNIDLKNGLLSPVPFGGSSQQTQSVQLGDLNSDTDLDIVIASDQSANVQIYSNNGSGENFESYDVITLPASARDIALADFNDDGALDLAVANYQSQSAVLLSDGTRSFAAPKAVGLHGGATFAVATHDLDGDGSLDAVYGNFGEPGTIVLGNGDGTVREVRHFGSPNSWMYDLSIIDIDGQFGPDIVVADGLGRSGIYYNNGTGHFYSGSILCGSTPWMQCITPFSSAFVSVATGDFNLDGMIDVAYGGKDAWYLFLKTGSKTFAPALSFPVPDAEITSIAVSDINGDGRLDIVIGAGGVASMYLNNSKNEFSSSSHFIGGISTGSRTVVEVADLSGDQRPDIFLTSELGVDVVFINQGGEIPAFIALGLNRLNKLVTDVAISDIDSDGDLDVVQTLSDQILIRRNEGIKNGQLVFADIISSELAIPGGRSIALTDMNHDGFNDLIIGGFGLYNTLILNQGGRFSSSLPFSPVGEFVVDVAVGDLDGDQSLDIVAGVNGSPSAVYLNDGQGEFPLELRRSFGSNRVLSIALGDLDGDHDLDILLAQEGLPPTFALNDGRANFTIFSLAYIPGMIQQGVLGDLDGDDDLDLVFAVYGGANSVFINNGDATFYAHGFIGTGIDATRSIILSDFDGDGDLDSALGNNAEGQASYIYYNNGLGEFTVGPMFTSQPVTHLAAGSLDDNESLDIIVAYGTTVGAVLLNRGDQGYQQQSLPADLSNFVTGVAVADVNGDSYLDILLAKPNQGNSVLLNSGNGNFYAAGAFGDLNRPTFRLATGDLDGDGDTDVVGADRQNATTVYFNGQQNSEELGGSPINLNIEHPGATHPANFFADSGRLETRTIPVTYQISSAKRESIRRIRASYSLNGGGTWREAVATADTVLTDLSAPPEGQDYIFNWDTFASGFFGQSDQVVFRIEAIPDVRPTRNSIAGNYQRPYVAATTMPFRVRGTQVRVVDQAGQPVAGAMVYRLPGGQSSGAAPLADSAGRPFRTDAQGYLAGRSALQVGEGGDQLVALRPMVVTDTYTLYHTSAPVNERGLELTAMTEPGVQTLTVSAERPLLLFNLDVALEWDARDDELFLTRLRDDLRRTSAILFDWSDGQVALGDVTLFHDARRRLYDGWDLWSYANVRVYATNRLRPNANKGGIVGAPTADPTVAGVEYLPGQIRIGAVWNRYGEASGTLGEDWPRTLAHELGHYLFALDENYLGLKDGILVPVAGCRSAMADPYRDDFSEFHPDAGWAADCDGTLSQQVNGRSDWESIRAFYPDAGLRAPTAFDANRGPGLLPLDVTTITESSVPTTTRTLTGSTEIPTATRTLDVPLISLEEGGAAVQPGPGARAFLFRDRNKTAIDDGDTIIDLGRPVLERVEARGAEPGDRLCVFEPEASRLGCEELRVGDQTLSLATNPSWKPEISLTPVTSRTLTVEVANVEPGLTLSARLYPIDLPAGPPVTLSYSNGVYRGVFDATMLTEPVFEGLLQIQVQDGSGREAVVDFALAGNPGHRWARTAPRGTPGHRWARTAPRGTPGHRWARTAPVISSDGMAILYTDQEFAEGEFYSFQSVGTLSDAPAWATPVGQAYRLTATANAPSLARASISFSYLQRDVPAGQEGGLTVYHYDGTTWTALPPARSEAVNIVSAPLNGPGIYALMTSIEVELRNAGWNYIRYPGRGGAANATEQPVSEALSGLLRQPDLVSRLLVYHDDGPGTAPRWRLFAAGAPPYVNTLTHLTFGQDYYLWVLHRIDWPVQGSATTATALPQPPATFYGAVHSGDDFTATAGMLVTARVGATVCGQGTTGVVEGQVVYVVAVEAEGTQTGCGIVGRQVSFQVGDRLLAGASTWDDSRVQDVTLWPGSGIAGQRTYLPLIRR